MLHIFVWIIVDQIIAYSLNACIYYMNSSDTAVIEPRGKNENCGLQRPYRFQEKS